MTDKEVIEILRQRKNCMECVMSISTKNMCDRCDEAFDLAIKALEERPQGDLISRSALKEAVKSKLTTGAYYPHHFISLIDNAPTVEIDKEVSKQLAKEAREIADKNFKYGYEKAKEEYERPQGEFVKLLNERIVKGVCKWCQMNKHCELCEISRVFMIIDLTDKEMNKGGTKE